MNKEMQRDAQAYAWNWFALHAGQRLQMVNFWLVAIAFLAAAYVQAISNKMHIIALGIALTGVAASLAFIGLEERTRSCESVGEDALRYFEELNVSEGLDEITQLSVISHRTRRSRFDSYRILIRYLQGTVALMFALATLYALFH